MDVTVLDLPTAYWHQLTSTLHDQELEFPHCVRVVVIGGERALPNQLAAWIKRGPRDVRLVNSYGPTESDDNGDSRQSKSGRGSLSAMCQSVNHSGMWVPSSLTGSCSRFLRVWRLNFI